MKTPITYYGGKQQISKDIISIMNQTYHRGYAEVFAGGLAVFFAKRKVKYEIINDINGNVSNFYEAMKLHFEELQDKISSTLHDEYLHKKAINVYRNPEGFSCVERAWAFWIACNLSFGASPANGFQWVKNKTDNWSPPNKTAKKRADFLLYEKRLDNVTIFNRDAIQVIQMIDNDDLLIYADPPYIGANQAHYRGYKDEDFLSLLECLSDLKARFVLSCYPNPIIESFIQCKDWNKVCLNRRLGIVSNHKTKIEMIVTNFDFTTENKQLSLYDTR